jgi:hypothetical protein
MYPKLSDDWNCNSGLNLSKSNSSPNTAKVGKSVVGNGRAINVNG